MGIGGEIVGEVVGVGGADGAGGGEEHGVGVEAKAEVGMTAPVLEVVPGVVAGAGEVRDLVLGEAGGVEEVGGDGVKVGCLVVGGEVWGAVAGAGGERFPAQAGVDVDFEEVDADVGDAERDGSGEGVSPAGLGLMREAGDEVETDLRDAGLLEAGDLGFAGGGGV